MTRARKKKSRATKKPKKDRYVFLSVYGDEDDSPYLIINPPHNLPKLLKEWNRLDRLMCDDKPGCEEWDYVDKWLQKKGVHIIEVKEIRLDDYQIGRAHV